MDARYLPAITAGVEATGLAIGWALYHFGYCSAWAILVGVLAPPVAVVAIGLVGVIVLASSNENPFQ